MTDIQIKLANPRGFCAGVDRAIEIVERALESLGAPIYVRHEVVHNRFVVESLKQRGAIFVDELSDIPDGNTVIFSAHGVSQAVKQEADKRDLRVFDATCPLVTKVHLEVMRHCKNSFEVILIGHKGHPEVEGTMGQYRAENPEARAIYLVETPEDVAELDIINPDQVAGSSSVRYPDNLIHGRYRQGDRSFKNTLPENRGPKEKRHLLCHTKPTGCG